ncbi:snakin-2 [Diospyros lotus]|uniref:snakin-2 n=1 Tax=Diospyros lotus TaxID=55363 RepID=UPI0022574F15|nr:snakin-2 [Diospyros lotus]
MAIGISKPLIASLLVSLLIVYLAESTEMMNGGGSRVGRSLLQQIDCGAACEARCRLASRHKICMRACGTCCERCNCVPPGTSGNKETCPCYANMTTHGGKPKCP